ncbi:hypothetical protein MKX03_021890 [Papaver bracteatum]|nr:hypothetical protein MKX03_021890 [Papaver bracteatum]
MEILAVSGTRRRYYYCFFLVVVSCCFVTLSLAKPLASFAYKRFDEKTLSFDTEIGLYGDAKVVNDSGGGFVEMNANMVWSSGKVVHRKPIRLGNRKNPVSFSSYFSFSISSENGDGLAFMLIPKGFPLVNGGGLFGLGDKLENSGSKVVAVEFDTLKNVEHGDQNGNHVGIDLGSLVSVKVSNASSVNVVLNSGKKLHSWIDYDASSKRLEVRLCNFSESRPNDPLVSYQIDLSRTWKEEEVFVGIGSSSGNSTQTSSVYSWSFRLRRVPTWMHSEPLDPQEYSKVYSHENKPPVIHTRTVCAFKIVTVLLFGVGCGALAASIMLFLWTVFANRRAAVVPAEYPDLPVEYGYEKIKVVAEKATTDGKK